MRGRLSTATRRWLAGAVVAGGGIALIHFGAGRPLGEAIGVVAALAVAAGCGALLALGSRLPRALERVLSEQKAENLRFDTAINNMSQGLCFFDSDGRLIVCNHRYADLYKLPRALMKPGTTLEAIVEHRYTIGCFPKMDRSAYLAWRSRLAVSDTPSDTVVEHSDGRTFAIHHQPMPDGGWVATHEDITERQSAELRLRESEAQLSAMNERLEDKVAERTAELERTNSALASKEEEIRSVVEHMVDCVVTFDADGLIRSANPMVETIFGYTAREIIGKNVSFLVPALAHGAAGAGTSNAHPGDGDGAARESAGVHKSGERIALDVAVSQYAVKGERLSTAIMRDIRERVRIVADLEKARSDAETASRTKSTFVATMSHEIRTPMNGILGMIDFLDQTKLGPEQAEMLGTARSSAHSLLAIIEDVLDFSKIEANRIEIERRPMSIASVVQHAVSLTGVVAAGKNVRLAVSLDPDLPGAVWGDDVRLGQVLVNLIGNAIKFSNGRETAAVVSVRARVGARSADRCNVELAVEDNGIGMDAATLAHLFVPFAQADASTTRRFGGTGLGLAISRHLVDLMGGVIEVDSRPGVGSTFTVRIPFVRAPESVAADLGSPRDVVPLQPPPGLASPAPAAPRPELILVAEDNEINLKVITHQLRGLGFRPIAAADGRQALVLWREGGVGLLLTDLHMPEMDGYELAASVRSEENGRARIPIVAVTANAQKGEAIRCVAAGMDGYLTKPVSMAQLKEALEKWLPLNAAQPGSVASA
jgi:PAS domain S-box-containing protein